MNFTHAQLLSAISYNPDTGLMVWKEARGRCAAGSPAGYDRSGGYRGIRIFGKCLLLHRIAFFYMTGRDPLFIDHINGARNDNRWTNLREVTRNGNGMNMARQKRSRSGVTGVFWNGGKSKWTAKIKVRQVTTNLGHFDCFAEAVAARKQAERDFGFHANHGRDPTHGGVCDQAAA